MSPVQPSGEYSRKAARYIAPDETERHVKLWQSAPETNELPEHVCVSIMHPGCLLGAKKNPINVSGYKYSHGRKRRTMEAGFKLVPHHKWGDGIAQHNRWGYRAEGL